MPVSPYLRLLAEVSPFREPGSTAPHHNPGGSAVLVTTSTPPDQDPLVPQRLALIAVTAVVIGAGIGILTFMASPSAPAAVIAGLVAAGSAALAMGTRSAASLKSRSAKGAMAPGGKSSGDPDASPSLSLGNRAATVPGNSIAIAGWLGSEPATSKGTDTSAAPGSSAFADCTSMPIVGTMSWPIRNVAPRSRLSGAGGQVTASARKSEARESV